MDRYVQIVNQVLPILLLLTLGRLLGRFGFLSDSTAEDLKRIIVNLALPAVLFLSFLDMELKVSYVAVFVAVLALCVLLYLAGLVLARVVGKGQDGEREYLPLLCTGFEYGMLGVSLFGGAYGLASIGYIAVIALGHELFIWFIFLSLLLIKRDGITHPARLMRVFLASPVILGILSGLLLNGLGLGKGLHHWPVTGAVLVALKHLSGLAIPLILIVVGHGIRLKRGSLRDAVLVSAYRLALCIPLALALGAWFLGSLLDLGKPFQAGLFTLLILPPPFIIPLYMRGNDEQGRRYVNNVLAVSTVASITVFTIYLFLNPVL